jgi:hypothetical protein
MMITGLARPNGTMVAWSTNRERLVRLARRRRQPHARVLDQPESIKQVIGIAH